MNPNFENWLFLFVVSLQNDLRISAAVKQCKLDKIRYYPSQYWSHKSFKGTVVNLAWPLDNGDTLKITTTVHWRFSILGLFSIASIPNHSCICNTVHTFDTANSYRYTIYRAGGDVLYNQIYWCTIIKFNIGSPKKSKYILKFLKYEDFLVKLSFLSCI